jgi:hypothetical protein
LYGPRTGVVQGSAPLVVRSVDQSCMVFGPGFPYKLCQLSSSNKISGKLKLPPSVQKIVAIAFRPVPTHDVDR